MLANVYFVCCSHVELFYRLNVSLAWLFKRGLKLAARQVHPNIFLLIIVLQDRFAVVSVIWVILKRLKSCLL